MNLSTKMPHFLKKSLRPLKINLVLFSFLLTLQAIVLVLLPLPLKEVIDHIDDQNYFIKMIGLSFFLCILVVVLDYIEALNKIYLNRYLKTNLKKYFFKKFLSQNFLFHNSIKPMSIVNHINKDVQISQDIVVKLLTIGLRSLPSILFLLIALIYVYPPIIIFLLISSPIYVWMARKMTRKLKKMEKKLILKENQFHDNIYQSFESITMIKGLHLDRNIHKIIMKSIDALMITIKARYGLFAKMNVFFRGSRVLVSPFLLFMGGIAIQTNKITLGDLVLIASYLDSLQRPIFQISRLMTKVPKGIAALQRLEEIDSITSSEEDTLPSRHLEQSRPHFNFKDLLSFNSPVFSYKESSTQLKVQEDLKILQGQLISLIGQSGSGKSTFFKLLNRLLILSEGDIKLKNKSIYDYELSKLRHRIKLITQENLLFPLSVYENLKMACEDENLNEDKIWKALSLVEADQFVKDLPYQLSQKIGRGGHPLSGGQMKRICLARGLLNLDNVDLLLLDEPTTGLDDLTAQKILKNLKELSHETNLSIWWTTHNLSEIHHSDRSFSMNQGLLTETL